MTPLAKKSAADDAHKAEASEQLSPIGRKLFKYVEFDQDEELLSEIRKHPIGVVVTAASGIFISLSVFIAAALLAGKLENINVGIGEDSAGSIKGIIISLGLLLSLFGLAITAISIFLYLQNVIYVTNQKIAQVGYLSLFNRKVTQLGIGNLEDVTVSQRGVFAHIFGYGTLLIETAGENPNPEFSLVPNPYPESQIITGAHEAYVEKYGN